MSSAGRDPVNKVYPERVLINKLSFTLTWEWIKKYFSDLNKWRIPYKDALILIIARASLVGIPRLRSGQAV